MSFNPHITAINIIKDIKSYSHARRKLKIFGLTKSEQDKVIKMVKEKYPFWPVYK